MQEAGRACPMHNMRAVHPYCSMTVHFSPNYTAAPAGFSQTQSVPDVALCGCCVFLCFVRLKSEQKVFVVNAGSILQLRPMTSVGRICFMHAGKSNTLGFILATSTYEPHW